MRPPDCPDRGLRGPQTIFLKKVRKLCDENNSLLILDEIVTGFRFDIQGGQKFFDIKNGIKSENDTYKLGGYGYKSRGDKMSKRREVQIEIKEQMEVYQHDLKKKNQ